MQIDLFCVLWKWKHGARESFCSMNGCYQRTSCAGVVELIDEDVSADANDLTPQPQTSQVSAQIIW